jgi:lipopolysaccharide export system protein LptC
MRAPTSRETTSGAGRRRVRAYSRLVAWMKVALPLAALAVMSALFISAQKTGDLTEIFTAEELVTLGAGLRLDNPRFAGVTEQGEPFAIRAEWALPDSAMPRFVDLERPEGEIEMKGGRTIAAHSATGRMHREKKILVLEGGVVIDAGSFRAATGRDPEGGPEGRTSGGGQIWFENRVRVVFIPAKDHGKGDK